MRVKNESTCSVRSIQHLIAWAVKVADTPHLTLVLRDSDRLGTVSGGLMQGRLRNGRWTFTVTLILSRDPIYPVRTPSHVPEVDQVWLYNRDEEILLVLLHELRHVKQVQWGIFSREDSHANEVDAEQFAVDHLQLYRRLNERRRSCLTHQTLRAA